MFKVIYASSELTRNQLTIDQGQTVVLTPLQLLALTESVPTNNLILTASNVMYGRFARINSPSISIFNFTQAEINNSQIQFTHDDSYNPPTYQLTLFDGFNVTNPKTVIVDFDQKPRWVSQQITINNGGNVGLSPADWLAIDDRDYSQLITYQLRNVSHGVFALSSTANPLTNPITSFSQQQINDSKIHFVHDNSNIMPSCEVIASDGRLSTSYQSCKFNFILNRAPQLTINRLSLSKGEQKVVDATSLAATDPDELTTSELGQLLFNFTAVQRGQFSLSTNPTAAIFSAYQNQIAAGQLLFQHDGSDTSPSYNVTVSDGFASTESQAANISFSLNPLNPQSQVIRDNTNAAIGGAIGGVGGALLLAGVGIFGAYRYRRNKALAEERSNSPLANALYEELQIAGTEDFQSRRGVEFVNGVNALNNELIRIHIDAQQMVAEELNELARKLANAAKAQLGKKINPLDLQDYAQEIVSTAMTLSSKKKNGGDVLVEMDEVKSSAPDLKFFQALQNSLLKQGIKLEALSETESNVLIEKIIATVAQGKNTHPYHFSKQ